MAELQKINLGTAPAGRDGDPARTANQKMNDNVDVLSAQSALTTAPMITASRTLTSDHIGRRVSISIAADGGVVKLIAAAKCEPDAIVWLMNTGAKRVALAAEDGSGDSLALAGLNPGEGAVMDSDGVSAWRVLLRGRSSGATETIEGDLRVMGAATFDTRPTFAGKVPYDNGNLSPVDTKSDQSIGGKKDFSQRPTFAGKVPWDSGNFNPASYAGLSGATFTGGIASAYVPTYWGAAILVSGELGGSFVDWPKTPTALRMECRQNGAAYKWLHAQCSGERDLAAVGVYSGGSSSSVPFIYFSLFGGQNQFQFYANGNATFSGALTQYSDYRIKTNVEEIDQEQALMAVCDSRPVEYDRIDMPGTGRAAGYIAHELQVRFPLLVSGRKDAVMDEMQDFSTGPQLPPKKVPDLQGVNYIGMIPYHSAAIRALESRLTAAVRRIEELERRNDHG
ncbi:tail fiber domain-containing protein [Burkholderia ubonensis]|uniref:tail fiber domain-containing protein n=1 Tax=Burkholderia ubonensis TaxID=101571 RepID=UPI000754C500|nr:tail fiber domain-containing protein [Burkholderia ubonensis]KWC11468.1 hypothetical protein WL47_24875 [Burkholderia ubonensis]